jgi:hypothetical protein
VSEVGEPGQSTDRGEAVGVLDPGRTTDEWADLRPVIAWVQQRRPVLAVAVVLIVAQLAWRAHFLSHLYFHQDDYFNLDLAARSGLSWHYLTFVGVGHFMIGQRLLDWLLVRISLYSWGLASAVVLGLLAAVDIAMFVLLRKLFGERPATLVLFTIYLLYPLALPDFGYWTAATESLGLQLAIAMALLAHINWVRTGRTRSLVAAAIWVGIGLISIEKALILPVLLFAVTAGFLTDARTVLGGIGRAFLRYRRAWLLYAAVLAVYLVLLVFALRTASSGAELPHSAGAVWTYVWGVVKDALLPGAIGGPWQWLKAGGAYALAAPPGGLIWLAVLLVLAVVAVSLWRRPAAWRAWAILALWLAAADLIPVILRRLNGGYPILFALDTRYLAELAVVGSVCLGLAFLPLAGQPEAGSAAAPAEPGARPVAMPPPQALRAAAAAVFGIFVVGALWSAQAYANDTTGAPAASYLATAKASIQQAARGTSVIQAYVPAEIFVGYHESYGLVSTVLGPIDPGKLHWVTRPDGTIGNLAIFSADGRLHPAWVDGASSGHSTAKSGCWPAKHGRIVVRFLGTPPYLTVALRIGYIWGGQTSGVITVRYGSKVRQLTVLPGLHAGYLPVTGTAAGIVVTGMDGTGLCVGDVEAGDYAPVSG